MYSAIRIITIIGLLSMSNTLYAQKTNNSSLEVGVLGAGDESLYYGGYGKFIVPLSNRTSHFTISFTLTAYFDFKGESEPDAYLADDIDMRIIPTVNFGYSLNFNKVQLNFEVPVGLSYAHTKGTLINERIGFERDYSNNEVFFNYGFSFSPKYKINNSNSIGITTFLPLIKDKAQSGYQIGIGWTKTFANNVYKK
ncbi:conserved hypothetical protein [Formosa agariphila KMM 3901]|uniref:Outer membrane protein beta-barrel domain-containing protein n=1 Tax=Formosa agariphila (strain DSM 15362 / KCTC 12365 / LMG 23005 / KMM 3901 / M-2Alg 35-1) TaxID=1347342 RepID=T2KQL2_FORAG|nr:hypothetical protein [Formosa agariphila]CDF80274.1 conserved hypothetical protein [Formosa agariphila KMM 3901]